MKEERKITNIDIIPAVAYIKECISDAFEQDGNEVKIADEMPLIGGESALDSMKLVELCIALEDKADEIGFKFDWTSETAMSTSRGMFRSIKSLAEEFINQFQAQQ